LDKNFAKAKVCGDFGGGYTVGADPRQVPGLTSKSKQPKAKVFPHGVAWIIFIEKTGFLLYLRGVDGHIVDTKWLFAEAGGSG
jgi:hypothetical protein